ncbi:MAG: hypothetical protein IBX72_03920 [Nitrospirae bacterium]|nr:hypothetical protein [Nitrospirota bacterium]
MPTNKNTRLYTDEDLDKFKSPEASAADSYQSFKNLLGGQAGKLVGIDLTKPRATTEPTGALTAGAERTLPAIQRSDVSSLAREGHTFTNKDLLDLYGPSREETGTSTLPSRAAESTLPEPPKPFEFSPGTRGLRQDIMKMLQRPGIYKKELEKSLPALQQMEASEISGYGISSLPEIYKTRATIANALGLTEAEVENVLSETEERRKKLKTLPASYEEEQAGKERIEMLKHPPKDVTASILDAATKFAGHFKDPVTGEFDQSAYESALPGLINSLRKHGLIETPEKKTKRSSEPDIFLQEEAERDEKRRQQRWSDLILEPGQTIRRNPGDNKLYIVDLYGNIVRPYE